MKKKNLFIATLLVVAATTIAVVSCKKENQDTLLNNNVQPVKTFTPPQVDDMNAYLKEFKQKMQSATRGDNETLGLEEAAWYLSSVANYDFANANVEYNDIRFDTLYSTVVVTGGSILLSDLAVAYENISTNIDKFYHSLQLDNKHFRFIGATISPNGEITISLITTFQELNRFLSDTCWYFADEWEAMIECQLYFNDFPYPAYPAATVGRSELERALNLKENHYLHVPIRYYFTIDTETTFNYYDNIDPYGSPSYRNSRLYAGNAYLNPDIINGLCYYFDSCLGLGFSNCPPDEYIIRWSVGYEKSSQNGWWIDYHILTVSYGEMHEVTPNPGGQFDY